MKINLQKYSFRFAEQVLNSKLTLKQEIENILLNPCIELHTLNRPHFNKVLENLFINKGWETQPKVFDEKKDPSAKFDFLKERIGIEVGFTHSSFIGINIIGTAIFFLTIKVNKRREVYKCQLLVKNLEKVHIFVKTAEQKLPLMTIVILYRLAQNVIIQNLIELNLKININRPYFL